MSKKQQYFFSITLLFICIQITLHIFFQTSIIYAKKKQTKIQIPKSDIVGMIYIPAGEFIMGTDTGYEYEEPRYVLFLKSFYIDKYEVTNKQYKIFIDATNYSPPLHWKNGTYSFNTENLPVVNVSYYDALTYAKWAGKRLPTEQEWEKSARWTDGRIYPWGNEWNKDLANIMSLLGLGNLKPVGTYPKGASAYGIYDISGNVWEWTDSYFQPYPKNKKNNKNFGVKYKVIRGGSYKTTISMCQTFRRDALSPDEFQNDVGFRCAK